MIATNFIQDEESLKKPVPYSEMTVASTHTDPDDQDRPWIHVSADEDGNVVAEEIPWELREDPDEESDEMDLKQEELRRKKRLLLINTIGTFAYISAAALGCAMGNMGWLIVILMTIAIFCMDRK